MGYDTKEGSCKLHLRSSGSSMNLPKFGLFSNHHPILQFWITVSVCENNERNRIKRLGTGGNLSISGTEIKEGS